MNTLLIVVILCSASFVHGFTGFGYGMVAMAFLPLFMSMPEALFLGALFTLPAAMGLFWRNREHFVFREAWPLIVGAVVGTPIGFQLVHYLDPVLLLRLLGLMLVLFSLNELLLSHYWRVPVPVWLAFPIGMVCGILGATFNIGGPPAIVFVYSRPWPRAQAIATLQAMFFFNSGFRVLLTLPTGIVTTDLAILCAEALIPFIATLIFGAQLAMRLPPRRFKQIVLVSLIAMGLRYLMSC